MTKASIQASHSGFFHQPGQAPCPCHTVCPCVWLFMGRGDDGVVCETLTGPVLCPPQLCVRLLTPKQSSAQRKLYLAGVIEGRPSQCSHTEALAIKLAGQKNTSEAFDNNRWLEPVLHDTHRQRPTQQSHWHLHRQLKYAAYNKHTAMHVTYCY